MVLNLQLATRVLLFRKGYYKAVTKLNPLLSKLLPKHDRGRVCSNCFMDFQIFEKFKNENSCRNHDHVELEMPQKFKTKLNK